MIKTIIFDFGDIFINLDKKGALNHALDLFSIDDFDHELLTVNSEYEKGSISTGEFIGFYRSRFPHIGDISLVSAWNYIIRDFPEYRLNFLKSLRKELDIKCILLSNTNDLHIKYVKQTVPFYKEFKNQFDRFYLSHEVGMRKPDPEIFRWVLEKNDLNAEECLFIDDTPENTTTAAALGINTWNLDPEKEDIIELTDRFQF